MTGTGTPPMTAKPTGYRHDVFLSYSQAKDWPIFVDGHFRPMLDHWLTAELGSDVRVFQDTQKIQAGHDWRSQIEGALAASKVMVALISRSYFRSPWCRNEMAAMLCRAETLRQRGIEHQIIFPVALHDCDLDDLPPVVRSLQIVSIHDEADPYMRLRSARRERLSRKILPVCAEMARRLQRIPDETFTWPPPDDTRFRDMLIPPPRPGRSFPELREDS